jgi:hypothetical protein
MQSQGMFKAAVEATPTVRNAYCPGLQALKKTDRSRLADRELATGSVFVDETLKNAKLHPDGHRWDYGIGLFDASAGERILWLEPHHAASKQTEIVLAKLDWLKTWLRTEAPELNKLPSKFVWLLTNTENNPNDRRRRAQAAERRLLIRVQGTLHLSRF